MRLRRAIVNRIARKSYLTLSAVADLHRRPDPSATVILEDHGLPLISIGPVPPEAVARDERDPYIETETELRFAWGDR